MVLRQTAKLQYPQLSSRELQYVKVSLHSCKDRLNIHIATAKDPQVSDFNESYNKSPYGLKIECQFQGDTSVVVLFAFGFGVLFLCYLNLMYVFIILVKPV